MLIAALQINIGLPTALRTAELGSAHEHGTAGGTGVDPHVERVLAFARGFRARPIGRPASGPQRLHRRCEPDIRALALDPVGGLADDPRVENGFACRIVEGRDGHTPGALTRDAPVGPRLHGALDAVLAPVGNPVHRINGGQRLLPEGQGPGSTIGVVHANEPLVHSPENDRRLGAPAMGIAVRIIFPAHQRLLLGEQCQHGLVGLRLASLGQGGLAHQ